jgi:hypothetical protein
VSHVEVVLLLLLLLLLLLQLLPLLQVTVVLSHAILLGVLIVKL